MADGSGGGDMGSLLKGVLEKIAVAYTKRSAELGTKKPRLVAASKTKTKQAILSAYENGQTHFGENYVQELVEKGRDPDVLKKCTDIKWHFIGHLQRNKVNKVLGIPNLFCVETVDTDKLANALNTGWKQKDNPLKVMVQINTSAEQNKSGTNPDNVITLVNHVLKNCPNLQFIGLMTIGSLDHDLSKGVNPDFQLLANCRKSVCEHFGFDLNDIELSMGMSHDYEHAVEMGSTNVRVGTAIFGERNYEKEKQIQSREKDGESN